jgi:microcystin-dependent protein
LAELDSTINAIAALLSPTGTLAPTLRDTEPGDGWKICNGQTLLKTEYPALYDVIGATYGEDDETFTLPDLRGRSVLGAGGDPALELANTGGAASVTLTEAQLPEHSHAVTDPGHTHTFTGTPHSHGVTDPGHAHTETTNGATGTIAWGGTDGHSAGATGTSATGISIDDATAAGTNSTSSTGVTVGNTGGGESVPIIPPVVAVNWMIRT